MLTARPESWLCGVVVIAIATVWTLMSIPRLRRP